MMAGFYTKEFSSILPRFAFTTRWVMGRNIKMAIAKLRKVFEMLYEKFPEGVEREHKVTRVLKEMRDTEKRVEQIGKEEFRAAFFNEENEKNRTLKTIKEIEEIWLDLKRKHKGYEKEFDSIEKDFSAKMDAIIAKGEAQTKEIDLKSLGVVIRESEKPFSKEIFMANVRTLLKEKELPRLAELAGWIESRRVVGKERKLKIDEALTKKSLKELRTKGVKPEVAISHLKVVADAVEKDASYEFLETYILYKRIFFIMLILLRYIDYWVAQLEDYKRRMLLPKKPVDELMIKLEKDKEKIAKNAHILAQGFLIIISKEERLRRLAKAI